MGWVVIVFPTSYESTLLGKVDASRVWNRDNFMDRKRPFQFQKGEQNRSVETITSPSIVFCSGFIFAAHVLTLA